MTKKEIYTLANDSYVNGVLNEKKVLGFVKFMDRRTVKIYLRILKNLEKKNRVSIALPSVKGYNKHKETLEQLFTDKQVIFEEDPRLILGLRILNDDMIYEQSIQNSLDTLVSEVKQGYE